MASTTFSHPSTAGDGTKPGAIHLVYRRVHKALHFERGYNFPLFIIFAGALMGFTLARLQYLSINGIFITRTVPSDALHYSHPGTKRVAIILHLATILPAAFLVCVSLSSMEPPNVCTDSFTVSIRSDHPPQSPPLSPPQWLRYHHSSPHLRSLSLHPHPLNRRRKSVNPSRRRCRRGRNHHLRRPGVCEHQTSADRSAPRLDVTHLGVCWEHHQSKASDVDCQQSHH